MNVVVMSEYTPEGSHARIVYICYSKGQTHASVGTSLVSNILLDTPSSVKSGAHDYIQLSSYPVYIYHRSVFTVYGLQQRSSTDHKSRGSAILWGTVGAQPKQQTITIDLDDIPSRLLVSVFWLSADSSL